MCIRDRLSRLGSRQRNASRGPGRQAIGGAYLRGRVGGHDAAASGWHDAAIGSLPGAREPLHALVVNRTRDGGRSFETLRAGLPQQDCYDLVYRHGLDVAADGRALMMGSTTGNLWASGDAGDRWRLVSQHLPPIAAVRLG